MIEKLTRKIYNIYQQKRNHHRRAIQFKKKLVEFGLFEHGNINIDSNDKQTLTRRKQQVEHFIEHHSDIVSYDYNLKLKFLQYQYYLNPKNFSFLQPTFYKRFVKNQVDLNNMLSKNVDYGCSLVMAGVVHNWSRRKWNDWNKYVCFIYGNI